MANSCKALPVNSAEFPKIDRLVFRVDTVPSDAFVCYIWQKDCSIIQMVMVLRAVCGGSSRKFDCLALERYVPMRSSTDVLKRRVAGAIHALAWQPADGHLGFLVINSHPYCPHLDFINASRILLVQGLCTLAYDFQQR